MSLQDKVSQIYQYISEHLYLNCPDLEVSGKKYNSTLLLGLLTALTNGKMLVVGEYGLGKTTCSENIISLIHSLPKEVVIAATIQGHPEQTEEKIVARPNLGKLNQGLEEAIWSYSALVEPKLIDEFNRLPASKQSIILQGIDRGIWKYLNETIFQGDFALYATCNYKDSGNTDLIEPILDRFDIAVESKSPGINNLQLIRKNGRSNGSLTYNPLVAKFLEVYDSSYGYEEKQKRVRELQEKFRIQFKKNVGLDLLSTEELEEIKQTISSIKLDHSLNLFLDIVSYELGGCAQFGQKRSNEQCPTDCHWKNYLCNRTENALSIRSHKAIIKYTKSLAWFLEDPKANVEHSLTVLPYSIWHKLRFNTPYQNKFRKVAREEPLELFTAEKAVEELRERSHELRQSQIYQIRLLKGKDFAAAEAFAKKQDHPIFSEYLR